MLSLDGTEHVFRVTIRGKVTKKKVMYRRWILCCMQPYPVSPLLLDVQLEASTACMT